MTRPRSASRARGNEAGARRCERKPAASGMAPRRYAGDGVELPLRERAVVQLEVPWGGSVVVRQPHRCGGRQGRGERRHETFTVTGTEGETAPRRGDPWRRRTRRTKKYLRQE